MKITLDQVNIVVGDMDASAAFYEQLGIRFRVTPDWAAHHRNLADHGESPVDLDLDSQEFAPMWDEGWPGGTGVVLGFRVESRDDVDRLHGELTAAGHPSQQAPYDAFFGARYAVVTDPDGNAVGIMSPIDPSKRGPSPDPPS